MKLAQQALLSTIDRILSKRGNDPSVIDTGDKMALATQLVQLCVLHESEIQKATETLAQALGSSPHIPLAELASSARLEIENKRSVA